MVFLSVLFVLKVPPPHQPDEDTSKNDERDEFTDGIACFIRNAAGVGIEE